MNHFLNLPTGEPGVAAFPNGIQASFALGAEKPTNHCRVIAPNQLVTIDQEASFILHRSAVADKKQIIFHVGDATGIDSSVIVDEFHNNYLFRFVVLGCSPLLLYITTG